MTLTDTGITAEPVRDLLREQHPDLAPRPLRLGARGWDNQLWRLGDDLAVRLPWATERAGDLLRKEHAWLPALAPRLPLPVPVPQRLGRPSDRFPRPWTVTLWVPGTPADLAPATGPAAAGTLASFLTALHRPAPAGAPPGPGGPLTDHADSFAAQLAEATGLGLIPDPDATRAIWEDAVAAPPGTVPRCGSTPTCTPPTSSPATAPSAVSSTSGPCARATRHATSPPPGTCCRTAPPTTSTRPTTRLRTP